MEFVMSAETQAPFHSSASLIALLQIHLLSFLSSSSHCVSHISHFSSVHGRTWIFFLLFFSVSFSFRCSCLSVSARFFLSCHSIFYFLSNSRSFYWSVFSPPSAISLSLSLFLSYCCYQSYIFSHTQFHMQWLWFSALDANSQFWRGQSKAEVKYTDTNQQSTSTMYPAEIKAHCVFSHTTSLEQSPCWETHSRLIIEGI
jgi:hypothetical protein